MNSVFSMDELRRTPVWVLGAGKSGLAAARQLAQTGAEVFVSDSRPASEIPDAVAELERLQVTYETGGHALKGFPAPQFTVVSPGIPSDAPVVATLMKQGRPLFSEIEVASWFYYGTLIAVTGSNGKTTTTLWIEHILRSAGLEAVAAGNVGYPFCDMVRENPRATHAVVEVSSYQLETISTFRPHVSILTNISPDHLERHKSMRGYAEAKARVWMNQDVADWAVLPGDDPLIASVSVSIRPRRVPVFLDHCPHGGAGLEGGALWLDFGPAREKIINLDEIPLPGRHNIANAIASAAACRILQIEPEEIRAGLKSFHGVPHRLEIVGQNGRVWINDSKSTNVDSLKVALEATEGPIWLIAGGRDKGASYEPLRTLVQGRVTRLLLIGEGAARLESELGDMVKVTDCRTLEEAVRIAAQEAGIGTKILLSPGCASFDQFRNFEHRGERFSELVREVVRR